jgi:hypothetical protein
MRGRRALTLIPAFALAAGGIVGLGVGPAQAICNATPPDYPGCTQAQVKAIAHDNGIDWFNHRRFGQTNILRNLTANQKDTVEAAMKKEIRDDLQQDRSQALSATATDDQLSKWRTDWRGNSYTIDTFPYARYISVWENGTSDYQSCMANKSTYENLYAYSWCKDTGAKDWTFWANFAQSVDNDGSQLNMVCAKEIVVGAAGGATAGAIASIWTGPGTAAAAGIGGLAGGGGGLVGCAVDHLWDKVF